MITRNSSIAVLATISILASIGLLFVGRIPQDPAYHLFADTRALGVITNAWNVLSNIPFLIVGLYGLSRYRHLTVPKSKYGYIVLCLGVMLVGIGSAWYHLMPYTSTLLWDRLPMTIAFMSFFSLLLDERVLIGSKWPTLWPLLGFGIASVLYWAWTESFGKGDLRFYALVQFLPLALVPFIIVLFKQNYISNGLLVSSLVFYVLAKLFEHFDRQIFEITSALSGHSLKHLAAAVAVLCLIMAIPAKPDGANESVSKDS